MKVVIIIFVPTNVLYDNHNVCDTSGCGCKGIG